MTDTEFGQVRTLMRDVSGIIMAPHKKQLAAGRLIKRLKALGLASFREYVQLLQQPDQHEERRLAVDLLTTNETFFFREEAHFQFLRSYLMDKGGAAIKIWSAACSSGEEVYSLAMLLDSLYPGQNNWSLIGSDLCRHVLETAQQGIYPLSRASAIPQDMLRRYCLKGVGKMDGFIQMQNSLRQRVSFRCLNLNTALPNDLPFFDIIFLRNILIYFDAAGKKSIVSNVISHLSPGGFLFIGHSESLYGLDLPLTSCGSAIYFKEG